MTDDQKKQFGKRLYKIVLADLESKGLTIDDLRGNKKEYFLSRSAIYYLREGKFSLTKAQDILDVLGYRVEITIFDSKGAVVERV